VDFRKKRNKRRERAFREECRFAGRGRFVQSNLCKNTGLPARLLGAKATRYTCGMTSTPHRDATDEPSVAGLPSRQLSLWDSTSIIVGIIIGSGIYQSSPDIAAGAGRFAERWGPSLGASSASQQDAFGVAVLIGVWLVGGAIALVGAACYAELATAYPHAGGTYVYLSEAFGRWLGFAFAWAEFWIVRPGNIGAIAFVMARYARQLLPPLDASPHLVELALALAAVAIISLLNLWGLRSGTRTQNLLSACKVLGLAAIVLAAFSMPPGQSSQPLPSEPWKTVGLSLIFVMFAYGGWADMSFVAAEVRDPRRNISRALVLGIVAVAAIYLSVTLAFVWGLGFRGLATAQAVAAEIMQQRIGPAGSKVISLLVIVSCLGSINGTIFTGARVYYALGTHHPGFRWLGVWDQRRGIPRRSLVVQTAATMGLMFIVGLFPGGFERLVVFTTPFFFGFIALVGISLVLLRRRGLTGQATYRVPFFPLTPGLFVLSSSAMVYASVDYALRNPAREAWWALVVVVAGLLVGWIDWRQRGRTIGQAR
jgi:APA family basic amino acid/polyamine antiporter